MIDAKYEVSIEDRIEAARIRVKTAFDSIGKTNIKMLKDIRTEEWHRRKSELQTLLTKSKQYSE